jgi:hypothetical protein
MKEMIRYDGNDTGNLMNKQIEMKQMIRNGGNDTTLG